MVTVAGIDVPDSKLAVEAASLAREHSPAFLVAHCQRTFAFGALAAKAAGLQVRTELAYVAALLHDLGLTPHYEGQRRFEVLGADAACAWARGQGLSEEEAQVIWDAIALHTSMGIADVRSPECALVYWGAGIDVAGFGVEQLDPSAVRVITTEYPRDGFTDRFLALIETSAQRTPEAYALTWLAATASRCAGTPLPTSEDTLGHDPFVTPGG